MAKEYAQRDVNYQPVIMGVNDSDEPRQIKLTSTDRIKVDSNSSDGASSVGTGRTAHETAGVKYQLPSASCKRVCIQTPASNGDLANGGVVVIGDTNVVAAEATRRGRALFPTQSEWFQVSNTNLIYVDVTDDGAAYSWFYEV